MFRFQKKDALAAFFLSLQEGAGKKAVKPAQSPVTACSTVFYPAADAAVPQSRAASAWFETPEIE